MFIPKCQHALAWSCALIPFKQRPNQACSVEQAERLNHYAFIERKYRMIQIYTARNFVSDVSP